MPLDGEDEVPVRSQLDCFDHAVLGRDSGDNEVVAGAPDGLVVAAVDVEMAGLFAELRG